MEDKRRVSALVPYKVENDLIFVFLQKRAKDAKEAPGLFGFFGGGTEGNETPEEALLREIKEELDFVPEDFSHFGKYELPKKVMDLFIIKVNNDFESKIGVLEGEYGRWFSEQDFMNEKNLITGNLAILEELYQKLEHG